MVNYPRLNPLSFSDQQALHANISTVFGVFYVLLYRMQKLAPIILFVYNRPKHTRRALAALEKNLLAKHSHVYIISDAPKNAEAVEPVNQVRAVLHEPSKLQPAPTLAREENSGLAGQVIDGVTKHINAPGKPSVPEDDLQTSPCPFTSVLAALHPYEPE